MLKFPVFLHVTHFVCYEAAVLTVFRLQVPSVVVEPAEELIAGLGRQIS